MPLENGLILKIDGRLQSIAKAIALCREIEGRYDVAYLQKARTEIGYKWRALQKEIVDR